MPSIDNNKIKEIEDILKELNNREAIKLADKILQKQMIKNNNHNSLLIRFYLESKYGKDCDFKQL